MYFTACGSSQQIIVSQSEQDHWPTRRVDQRHIHYYYRRIFYPRDPSTSISSQPAVLDNLLTSMKFVLHGMGALRINLANNRNKVVFYFSTSPSHILILPTIYVFICKYRDLLVIALSCTMSVCLSVRLSFRETSSPPPPSAALTEMLVVVSMPALQMFLHQRAF